MRQIPISRAAAPAKEAGNALGQFAYVLLCAFVFVIPWEDTVPEFGGFVIGRWIGLLALGTAVMSVIVLAQGRKLRELHYWMLAFVGWSSVSIWWTMDFETTAVRIGTYSQLLVLVWLIWVLADTEARVLGLLQSYVFGTYVCAIGTISNLMAGRTTAQLDDYSQGELQGRQAFKTDRYTINGVNPNELGLMLAVSIPLCLYLVVRRKGSLARVLCWLQLVLCLTTILLSGSRGAMLAAMVALVMFPLTVFRLPRWQQLLAGVACAGVIVSSAFLVPPETWRRFLKLGSEISEGTMTHRTQIWAASMEVFRDHAFVGVGSGAHEVAVMPIISRPLVAHNTFLSVLVELGVAGELLLLGLLATAFYSALRMRGLERILWILTLAVWCIGANGGTWEYRKATWFLWSLPTAHAYVRRKAKSQVLCGRVQARAANNDILLLMR